MPGSAWVFGLWNFVTAQKLLNVDSLFAERDQIFNENPSIFEMTRTFSRGDAFRWNQAAVSSWRAWEVGTGPPIDDPAQISGRRFCPTPERRRLSGLG